MVTCSGPMPALYSYMEPLGSRLETSTFCDLQEPRLTKGGIRPPKRTKQILGV